MAVLCESAMTRASHRKNVITNEEIIVMTGVIFNFDKTNPTTIIAGKPANFNRCSGTECEDTKKNTHAEGATANAYTLSAQR